MEKKLENSAIKKYCLLLEGKGRILDEMDSYRVFNSATEKEHVYDIYCRVEFEGVFYVRKVYTVNLDFLQTDEEIKNAINANCKDAYVIDLAFNRITDKTYDLVPSALDTQNKIRKELLEFN